MEQIDLLDIQKIHRSLTASWRRWEEAPNQDHRKALGEALRDTKAQLAAWLTPEGGESRYADQSARTLADQISAVEEVIVQHDQKQSRGY
jgi:hypothetical protein